MSSFRHHLQPMFCLVLSCALPSCHTMLRCVVPRRVVSCHVRHVMSRCALSRHKEKTPRSTFHTHALAEPGDVMGEVIRLWREDKITHKTFIGTTLDSHAIQFCVELPRVFFATSASETSSVAAHWKTSEDEEETVA